jgi:hypothetical protein
MFEDLREQVIEEGAFEFEEEEEGNILQSILGLEAWQRLVLAILLFFNVALCGCMALVMIGRVVLPF